MYRVLLSGEKAIRSGKECCLIRSPLPFASHLWFDHKRHAGFLLIDRSIEFEHHLREIERGDINIESIQPVIPAIIFRQGHSIRALSGILYIPSRQG